MYQSAQTLAAVMKANEAMLLSRLYEEFLGMIQIESKHYPSLSLTEETHFPRRRWVLSRLHSMFGESLTMVCKHDRYGTLLFHKGCDLVKALSTALGRGTKYTRPIADCSVKVACELGNTSSTVGADNMHEQIRNVASHMNDLVHEQAKKMITFYQNEPQRYKTFDVGSYIKMTEPILLQFIQQLTQSVRSKRRKLFETEAEVRQTKQMRQLFLLSSLLFCTNTQCSMPLHILVTEATLCHGGTQELVKMLNRIGAGSSIDTSQRLATQVVHSRIVKGILPELEKNALSIVSIDNIDILQPHAFVSSTDATRSWHGTSVQCVQPLPTTGILEQGELTKPTVQFCSRKHPATSPTASPIIVEKSKQRRRTLNEPHSTVVIPQAHAHQAQSSCNTAGFDSNAYNIPIPSIHLEDFSLNASEKEAVNTLQDDVFMCMLLKHAAHNSQKLPNLQSLMNCVRRQTTSIEESKVVYVKISSERADSRPTLIATLSEMYKMFVTEQTKSGYWLLVMPKPMIL